MQFFWKYLFPPLFGLLIYATIRLINDTLAYDKFWERPLSLNIIEVSFCITASYIQLFILRRLFARFDRSMHRSFNYQFILKELLWVFIITQLCINALITPMAAFTSDGLSWGDFAIINVIPLLYSLVYYAVARSHKLLQVYVNNRLQLEKVTNDHLQTELKFLKAQYHPHFLFNALNTIYFQMDEDVQGAKRTVEKFSELLRYQLYDQQQTVPIGQELQYLQNFIELQQIRNSDKLQLQVCFDPGLNGQQVYPLLFLPLVENAFKYVGGDYRLQIEARQEAGTIRFTVVNSIPEHYQVLHQASRNGRGIGLENLQRRLELLYPGKYQFSARQQDHFFITDMTIDPR
jgi:two-component system LytT family sensor kinase